MAIKKQFLKSKPVVKVTFEVSKEASKGADNVYLLCEVNKWKKQALKKLKTGSFKATFEIPTNKKNDYEYKYCLVMNDGTEIYDNDWKADAYRPNNINGENSVLKIQTQNI